MHTCKNTENNWPPSHHNPCSTHIVLDGACNEQGKSDPWSVCLLKLQGSYNFLINRSIFTFGIYGKYNVQWTYASTAHYLHRMDFGKIHR